MCRCISQGSRSAPFAIVLSEVRDRSQTRVALRVRISFMQHVCISGLRRVIRRLVRYVGVAGSSMGGWRISLWFRFV